MRTAAIAALTLALGAPALAQSPSLPPVDAALMAPALRVADCAKVQAFYQSALGMTVLMSRDLGKIHETMLAFSAGQPQGAIMLLCPAAGQPPAAKGIGGSRLIIRVGSLDALGQRLDALGLPHPPVRSASSDPVRVLNLTDPEGNELELVQMNAAARSKP